jgi:hypothetical protein
LWTADGGGRRSLGFRFGVRVNGLGLSGEGAPLPAAVEEVTGRGGRTGGGCGLWAARTVAVAPPAGWGRTPGGRCRLRGSAMRGVREERGWGAGGAERRRGPRAVLEADGGGGVANKEQIEDSAGRKQEEEESVRVGPTHC